MNRIASAELISADSTAARPMSPAQAGTPRVRISGRAVSAFSRPGATVCAIIPRAGGRNAKSMSATPQALTPSRTVRTSRAPNVFCRIPGETMKAGASRIRYIHPESPLLMTSRCPGVARACSSTAESPPAPSSASGTAIRKPHISTTSCTRLTQAELSRPPAMKYTVMTTPPTTAPSHRGAPATTSRIQAMAISCPARMASVPTQSSAAMDARTEGP